MISIEIIADNHKNFLEQIQDKIGGSIVNSWNESTLTVDNENACGILRYIPFDWGVSLLDFDITLHKEFIFKIVFSYSMSASLFSSFNLSLFPETSLNTFSPPNIANLSLLII